MALLGAAGVTTPAALGAEAPFTVQTDTSIEVGARPSIQISGDDAVTGRLRVAVLSTLGEGKGMPKDKRQWQTQVPYGGKQVTVEGPVLRIGDYRVKVWFTPKGSTSEAELSGGTTAFTVSEPQAHAGRDGGHAVASDEGRPSRDTGWWAVVALLIGGAAVGAIVRVVRLRRRRSSRSRRTYGGPWRASEQPTDISVTDRTGDGVGGLPRR